MVTKILLCVMSCLMATAASAINITCHFDLTRDNCLIKNLQITDSDQAITAVVNENGKTIFQTIRTVQIKCGAETGNDLSSLPDGLFKHFNAKENLPKLRYVIVQSCHDITSLNGHEFEHAASASLINLTITQTGLEAIADDTFAKLSKVYHLDLSRNKLSELSDGVFKGLVRLIHLDLSSNNLKFLRENLFDSNSLLFSLNLEDNQLAVIEKSTLTIPKALKIANLRRNSCVSFRFDGNSIALTPDIFEKNCSMMIAESLQFMPPNVKDAEIGESSYRLAVLLYITMFSIINIAVLLYYVAEGEMKDLKIGLLSRDSSQN